MFQNAAREPLSQSLSHLFGQNQAPWLLLSQSLTGKGAAWTNQDLPSRFYMGEAETSKHNQGSVPGGGGVF